MSWPLHRWVVIAFAGAMLCTGSALAQSAAQISLDRCQKTVAKAAGKYVSLRTKAVASCLQKISGELVKRNSAGVQRAAGTCVAQLRKINDTRGLGKDLEEKMRAKVDVQCDPSVQPHTLPDLLGTGAGVPESLQVENLDPWCVHFGGDGAIDDLDEWLDCIVAAQACQADQAVSVQYARALEWLALAKTEVQGLSAPAGDPDRIADALAALDALIETLALEPDGSGGLDLACGISTDPDLTTCREDLATCRQDLAQALVDISTCNANLATCQDDVATCNSDLGACQDDLATCSSDLTACQDDVVQTQSDLAQVGDDLSACQDDLVDCQGLPATGQTISFGSGSDGDVQAGLARSFADNGDGTITDHVAGLMWEKKHNFNDSAVNCANETSSCANPHDADNKYTWCERHGSTTCVDSSNPLDGTVVTIFLDQLNHRCDSDPSVDCKVEGDAACELALGAGERCGFAGYRDWRLPTATERLSLANFGTSAAPFEFPAFITGCSSSCDVRQANTCSCRSSGWSSTTYTSGSQAFHWENQLNVGFKSGYRYARAVRRAS